MANKVLLIRPRNVYNYNNYPSLGLICIGSKLKSVGYDVKIINCAFETNPFEVIRKELKNTLFAGITLLTSEAPNAYQIMKFIKENSNVPVIVGGWHCTLFPQQMADCEYVDYVVSGEGEEHIVHIAEALRNGAKVNHKIFSKQILDIETLPPPEYAIDSDIEKFINNYLTDKLSEYIKQPMRWLPYESSRGCPSHCTFCINFVTDNTRYRKKGAEKVVSEIEVIVKKYNINHLKIVDDNFFVDIERVRQICAELIRKNIHITWDGECRCDYFNDLMLNDETLKLCKASGLIQLTIGVESGSTRTLAIMKKGITPEQAEYAVKRCNEYGIIARSSFMIEVPGETKDDIKQTIHFINRLRKYPYFTCGIGTFRPYPKCELTEELIKDGYLKEPGDFRDWSDRTIVDMYTSVEYRRPWQVNGKFSESVAYYLNMESAVRLGNYQIDKKIDRMKNNIFMAIAKLRNRLLFYKFPMDIKCYKSFLTGYYERRQVLEKKETCLSSKIAAEEK